jgi:hypothetical protein
MIATAKRIDRTGVIGQPSSVVRPFEHEHDRERDDDANHDRHGCAHRARLRIRRIVVVFPTVIC